MAGRNCVGQLRSFGRFLRDDIITERKTRCRRVVTTLGDVYRHGIGPGVGRHCRTVVVFHSNSCTHAGNAARCRYRTDTLLRAGIDMAGRNRIGQLRSFGRFLRDIERTRRRAVVIACSGYRNTACTRAGIHVGAIIAPGVVGGEDQGAVARQSDRQVVVIGCDLVARVNIGATADGHRCAGNVFRIHGDGHSVCLRIRDVVQVFGSSVGRVGH